MVKKEPTQNSQMLRMVGQVLPHLPFFLLKMGRTYLSFKQQIKRSSRVFEKELCRQGLDKETAALLKKNYLESNNISDLLRG